MVLLHKRLIVKQSRWWPLRSKHEMFQRLLLKPDLHLVALLWKVLETLISPVLLEKTGHLGHATGRLRLIPTPLLLVMYTNFVLLHIPTTGPQPWSQLTTDWTSELFFSLTLLLSDTFHSKEKILTEHSSS